MNVLATQMFIRSKIKTVDQWFLSVTGLSYPPMSQSVEHSLLSISQAYLHRLWQLVSNPSLNIV